MHSGPVTTNLLFLFKAFVSCIQLHTITIPVHFLRCHCICQKHGLVVHSYADDTQLCFRVDHSLVDSIMQQLLTGIEEISQCMCIVFQVPYTEYG